MAKRTKCKSGIDGWQGHLQENWQSLEELESAEINYGVVSRLGFNSAKQAWKINPTIRVSVIPQDLEVVKTWSTYVVRYWSHDPKINDCLGNSTLWTGKARNENEAKRKAEKFVLKFFCFFRINSIKQKID